MTANQTSQPESQPSNGPLRREEPEANVALQAFQELRRQPLSRFGLLCVALLVAIAVLAPFISCSQPLLSKLGGGYHSPLLSGLFNRLLFENAVDILFNLLLVLLGPYFLARWLLHTRLVRSRFPRARQWLARGFTVFVTLLFFALTPKWYGSVKNPLYFTQALGNRNVATAMASAGSAAAVPNGAQASSSWLPLRPFSYQDTNPAQHLEAPSKTHWLGTDTEGRDVFARLVYGTRISLTIGLVSVAIYISIGVLLGACAGYLGGWVDLIVSRLIEVMICIPSFFLVLTIAALIEERSIFHVMAIIGATSWPTVARLVRAEFLKQRNLEYVQAAVALGFSKSRIMFRHILPNALSPVLVSATFGIASAILTESSLAFLGVGDTTVSSWGQLLNAGRTEGKLWLVLAPGCAIFVVVSLFNLIGEGLRDALDPKLNS